MARRKRVREQHLPFRSWGGAREGAGRKPAVDGRAGVSHRARPSLAFRHPVHVTLRVQSGVPSLRSSKFVGAFRRTLEPACERGDFRVVHYSLQDNHVDLLVEADVLLNARHHAKRVSKTLRVDPASSGRWFSGWKESWADALDEPVGGGREVAEPRTWLLRIGWLRHGRIGLGEVPGSAR